MYNDFSTEDLNAAERIENAIRQSRRQQIEIDRLTEATRNDSRPIIIEENREKIARLTVEHIEYDEMTRAAYYRMIDRLNDTINRLFIERSKRELSENQSKMLEKALNLREKLFKLREQNPDIIYDDRTVAEVKEAPKKTSEEEEIEKKIEKFKNDTEKLEKAIARISASLLLDINIDVELTGEFKKLDDDIKELNIEAKALIDEIDKLKAQLSSLNISMDVKAIKKSIEELKIKVKKLKISQIDRYNARVEYINKVILELRGMTGLNPEIAELIAKLQELNKCDITVKNYTQNNYYNNLNYELLIEMYKKIQEIYGKLGRQMPDNVIDLESDMQHIENELDRLEEQVEKELTDSDIEIFNNDISVVANNINAFRVKLENNKDKITEEEYNKYLDRINDAEARLAEINEKLKKVKPIPGPDPTPVEEPKDSLYQQLRDKLSNLDNRVMDLDILVEALRGQVVESALQVYKDRLDKYDAELDEIAREVQKAYEENKLDDTQYDNLVKYIREIKNKIDDVRKKTNDYELVKPGMTDIFDFLNGQIDGIERAIDSLEEKINALEKPIKDKEIRKKIDLVIKRLEQEIQAIRTQLENHKEEDPEKYETTKARLEAVEARLAAVNKDYRKKCPFLVKAKKSAKEFYKKHKKLVLIAAGLAAIAIVHATVGPIIMPALMHGNLMIMAKVPALRSLLFSVNGVLGKLIGAKDIAGIWTLANGVTINPSCAAASLLKGVAISGIGTAMIVAPIVVAIKELVKKMNLSQLKNKMSEKVDETKKKAHEKTTKVKQKVKEKKTIKKNKDDKEFLQDMKTLLLEYKKSGLTVSEFAERYNLDEEDMDMLNIYDKKMGGR